jgi:hypothetical protein
MDLLDRLAVPAGELLSAVDDVLGSAGAPADHPVWTEVRRVRALPGAAVHAVVTLRPETIRGTVPAVRAAADAVLAVDLPGPGVWSGAAAEAYDAQRRALAGHLSEDLPGRFAATGAFAEALAGWMERTRRDVAQALAEVLGSAEAVAVRDADGAAAATIAARVLAAVADSYDRVADLPAVPEPGATV